MHKRSPDLMAHVKISNPTGSRAFVAMLLLQFMKYYSEESFLGGTDSHFFQPSFRHCSYQNLSISNLRHNSILSLYRCHVHTDSDHLLGLNFGAWDATSSSRARRKTECFEWLLICIVVWCTSGGNWGWVLVSHNAEIEDAPPPGIEGWSLGQTHIYSPSISLIDPVPQNSGSEATSSFHM